jgi:cytochrome o ubiquinol oxidase operon protein cyoD
VSGTHHDNAAHADSDYVHSYEGAIEPEHGTLKGYLTGFALAAVLTIIPFWLVMGHVLSSTALTIFLVLAIGGAQIFVHIVYFLHMNSSSEGGWNLMALLFTLVIFFVTLAGALWVMYNMNANMMHVIPHSLAHLAP